VNASFTNFTAGAGDNPAILFGLSAVRNVGEGLVGLIVTEREKNGPFADFHDFCCRVDPSVLNKRSVESLIKAGGFDSLGCARKGLLMVFEEVIDHVLALRRDEDLGISTLFSLLVEDEQARPGTFAEARREIPEIEFDKYERLAFEKEMLGLYVSDHPLQGREAQLRRLADTTIRELIDQVTESGEREGTVTVGGVVTNVVRRYTRRGELMATFILEDLEAAMEVFVFPKTMIEYGMHLETDAIVTVRGRIDARDDDAKLIAMEIARPELRADDESAPLEVAVPLGSMSETLVDRLRELVVEHPGPTPLHLRLGTKVLRLPSEFNVDPRSGLVGALRELLGSNAIGA
jgi:DNA polymerase-3 subunit alpha